MGTATMQVDAYGERVEDDSKWKCLGLLKQGSPAKIYAGFIPGVLEIQWKTDFQPDNGQTDNYERVLTGIQLLKPITFKNIYQIQKDDE